MQNFIKDNKVELAQQIAVMQAYLDGKTIEMWRSEPYFDWVECKYPTFNWEYHRYRVK